MRFDEAGIGVFHSLFLNLSFSLKTSVDIVAVLPEAAAILREARELYGPITDRENLEEFPS